MQDQCTKAALILNNFSYKINKSRMK